MEFIVWVNIIKHFVNNNLFSTKQFGFIKGRCTVTQLLEILDKWTDWLESGGQIDVIYMDLEKAFDKVSHKLLIYKLQRHNLILVLLNGLHPSYQTESNELGY